MSQTPWQARAACASAPLPTSEALVGAEDYSEDVQAVIDVWCASCPVRDTCRESGEADKAWGVWGGTVLRLGVPVARPAPRPPTAPTPPGERPADVTAWLADLLTAGPVDAQTLQAHAAAVSVPWSTVLRVRPEAGAVVVRNRTGLYWYAHHDAQERSRRIDTLIRDTLADHEPHRIADVHAAAPTDLHLSRAELVRVAQAAGAGITATRMHLAPSVEPARDATAQPAPCPRPARVRGQRWQPRRPRPRHRRRVAV